MYWYQFCLELQTRETPKQHPGSVELFPDATPIVKFRAKDQEKLYDTGEVLLSYLNSFKVLSLFKKLLYKIIYNGSLSPI